MSKAFTSEETPDAPPLTRSPPQLAPGEVRYITPEGAAALEAEGERLRARRAEVAALPETQRQGRLEELDQRIHLVEATLDTVTVLGPDAAPEGKVAFGTWVTVEDQEGHTVDWRLVGPDEADPKKGLISVHAPVARALVGREEGDTVEVRRPSGPWELTILSVRRTAP